MKQLLAVTLLALTPIAFASPNGLLGSWAYNDDLSSKTEPKESGSILGGKVRVSVGLPIPLPPGSPASTATQGANPKDPDVLYCQTMTIDEFDGKVVVTYGNLGSHEFVPGKHLGRKTSWTGKRLTESYSTMSRKVTQDYRLDRDGRLVVTVTLNPKQSKKTVYRRVFDRITNPGALADDPEPS